MRSALVPLVLALAACSEELPRDALVVLEIADRTVTMGELDRFIRMSVQQESPVLSPEVSSALFEQFVEEQRLLLAADAAGIEADPDLVAERMRVLRSVPDEMNGREPPGASRQDEESVLRNVEKQVRIEKLVSTEALAEVSVDEDEIERYFEAHREDFVRPETVEVSQILVDSEELAVDLRKRIATGSATFEEMAREHSRGPEAHRGGKLGSFTRGELPPSFDAVVFSLAPGAISEVVATDFGFHLFRVNAKTEDKPLELDEVREAVRVTLLREKSDEAMKRLLSELERRYPVKVHSQHLSFAVNGSDSARMEKGR